MSILKFSLTEKSIKLYASIYFMLFYATVIFVWAKGFDIVQYVTFFSAVGMLGVLGLLEFVIKKATKSRKKIWRLMQVSSLMYALGDLITEYFMWLGSTTELDGSYNILYLLSTSILIWALMALGFQNLEKKERSKAITDVGIVTISLITASWGVYVYPVLIAENVNLTTFLFSIWYLLTDIGLLASVYVFCQTNIKFDFSIKFIFIGVFLYVISDILNIAEIATNQSVISLLLYPSWVAGQYLIAYAGVSNQKEIVYNFSEKRKIIKNKHKITYIPYFSLMLLLILIAIYSKEKNLVTIGATLCSMLFILKQILIIFDNLKMVETLEVLNKDLLVNIDILEMENKGIEKEKDTVIREGFKDPFTGVYNRKYLAEYIEQFEWENKNDFSVLMIDIDNLKGINDSYGHKAGDLVISKVANIMQAQDQPGILISRVGGDEFILLVENANATKGHVIAERIRREVEETLFNFEGKIVNCSVSIGISERIAADEDYNSVFIKADKALYDAKSKGRNKSEIYIAKPYEKMFQERKWLDGKW